MNASRRFPDFYILGAPKAGTSSLAHYLDERSDVFVSDPKEPRYFADDFADRPFKDKESYLELFDRAAKGALLGEGTTDYLVSDTAVDRILDVRPDAKFIVMLRNPVQIMVAMHAQERKNGYETIADPSEAWAAIERRKSGTDVPALCNEPKRLFYDDRCRLGEQVKRLKDKVAPEQLMIIFMDDFAKNTRQAYRETLAFLGLEDEGREEFPVVNSRHHIKHPAMIQLWKFGTNIKNKLGLKTNFGLLNRVQQVGLTNEAAPESSDLNAFRQELRNYFCSDIRLLEKLTDRDLSGWSTPK